MLRLCLLRTPSNFSSHLLSSSVSRNQAWVTFLILTQSISMCLCLVCTVLQPYFRRCSLIFHFKRSVREAKFTLHNFLSWSRCQKRVLQVVCAAIKHRRNGKVVNIYSLLPLGATTTLVHAANSRLTVKFLLFWMIPPQQERPALLCLWLPAWRWHFSHSSRWKSTSFLAKYSLIMLNCIVLICRIMFADKFHFWFSSADLLCSECQTSA